MGRRLRRSWRVCAAYKINLKCGRKFAGAVFHPASENLVVVVGTTGSEPATPEAGNSALQPSSCPATSFRMVLVVPGLPALSSALSSLEIGQGLAALLPAGTPPTPLPARPGCRSRRGAGVNVGRRPSHSDAKRDLLRHRGVDDHQAVEGEGAVRLTDSFQRLLILAGLRRIQHPVNRSREPRRDRLDVLARPAHRENLYRSTPLNRIALHTFNVTLGNAAVNEGCL